MRVGLNRGTRGGRAEPWAVHMVHGRARVQGDEDGVGQVGENDSESSRRSVRRVRANDSKASRRGGRSDTCRYQRGRVVAKRRWTVSMVWASKPSAVASFPVSAAKSGADLARSRFGQRARDIISELASRRREVEEEPCPSDASIKIWTVLPLCG